MQQSRHTGPNSQCHEWCACMHHMRRWIAVAENMAGTRPPQVTLLDVSSGLERSVILKGPRAEQYSHVSFSVDGSVSSPTWGWGARERGKE